MRGGGSRKGRNAEEEVDPGEGSGADGEKKEKKEKKEGFYGMKREMRRLNLRVP